MTDQEHQELVRVLYRVKGRVVLSGYRCSLMDELYADWNRIDAPAKTCHSVKKDRTDALWTNF